MSVPPSEMGRRVKFAGLLLVIAGVLTILSSAGFLYSFAQYDDQDGSAPLAGRVVQEYRALPVEGVRVTVAGEGLVSYTDANGRYRFDSVPAGPRTVVFEKPGYVTIEVDCLVFNEKMLESSDMESNVLDIPTGNGPDSVPGAQTSQALTWAGLDVNETVLAVGTLAVDFGNGSCSVSLVRLGGGPYSNGTAAGNFTRELPPGAYSMNLSWANGSASTIVAVAPGAVRAYAVDLSNVSADMRQNGTVKGRIGPGVPANITLYDGDAEAANATSELDGTYEITAPESVYELLVEAYGFKAADLVNTTVLAGEVSYANATLSSLPGAETVHYSLAPANGCMVVMLILGVLQLAAGALALRRRLYGLAVLVCLGGLVPTIIVVNVPLAAAAGLSIGALALCVIYRRGFVEYENEKNKY